MVARAISRKALAALLGLSVLGACEAGLRESVKPQARPGVLAPRAPAPHQPSQDSRKLAAYYTQLEQHLLAQGLLRRGGGGPDTEFDAEDLAENFEAIAFFDEHAGGELGASSSRAASRFHPWLGPVRVAAIYGESVPASQRTRDEGTLSSFLARLTRVTGRPITTASTSRANFHVLFMSEDDSEELKETVRRVWPGFPESRIDVLADLPRDIYCLVHTNLPSARRGQERAIAVIRTEHPDLMRLACIHEEIAQGLGLSNDSPHARPSIFNDDEEFATLTTHDELLLEMLYDPRLKPGMTAGEARPLIGQIARELMGETRS